MGKRKTSKSSGNAAPKPTRTLPYKDPRGKWRDPKTGRYMADRAAKTRLNRTHREWALADLAKRTGRPLTEVKQALKGIPLKHIKGEYQGYSKKHGRPFFGEANKGALARIKRLGYDGPTYNLGNDTP